MKLLDSIKNFFNTLDKKTFSIYMGVYSVVCTLLLGFIIYYYYSSTGGLQKKIRNIDSSREEVLTILEKIAIVKQQQAMVEEILAKDPNFKIQGAFQTLLSKINLSDKKAGIDELTAADLEDNYRKNELTARFEGMTMQDLTRLLEEIEKNPRIATERLEIGRSRKTPKTIEVTLTISTLLPKAESPST